MENKSEVVDAIVEFVTRYSYEDITPLEIFKDTDYKKYRNDVEERDIELRLKESPFLVLDWVRFSEDQRHTPTWYMAENNGKWKTGFVDRDGKISKEKEFEDQFEACAHFIKYFMELMVDKNG